MYLDACEKQNKTTLSHYLPECHWILPACLWSGLVLTTIILFGLFYWREKRKSYRTGAYNM